jgi:hypothetical protein
MSFKEINAIHTEEIADNLITLFENSADLLTLKAYIHKATILKG